MLGGGSTEHLLSISASHGSRMAIRTLKKRRRQADPRRDMSHRGWINFTRAGSAVGLAAFALFISPRRTTRGGRVLRHLGLQRAHRPRLRDRGLVRVSGQAGARGVDGRHARSRRGPQRALARDPRAQDVSVPGGCRIHLLHPAVRRNRAPASVAGPLDRRPTLAGRHDRLAGGRRNRSGRSRRARSR